METWPRAATAPANKDAASWTRRFGTVGALGIFLHVEWPYWPIPLLLLVRLFAQDPFAFAWLQVKFTQSSSFQSHALSSVCLGVDVDDEVGGDVDDDANVDGS